MTALEETDSRLEILEELVRRWHRIRTHGGNPSQSPGYLRFDTFGEARTRSGTSAVEIDAVAQFVAGGLLGLLIWWLDGRPRLSVAEVDALFRKLATPALSALAR